MTTSRSYADVKNELNNANITGKILSLDYLKSLITQLSIAPDNPVDGAVTLFYSADVAPALSGKDLASEIHAQGNGQTILLGDTDAGAMVDDKAFRQAITNNLKQQFPGAVDDFIEKEL